MSAQGDGAPALDAFGRVLKRPEWFSAADVQRLKTEAQEYADMLRANLTQAYEQNKELEELNKQLDQDLKDTVTALEAWTQTATTWRIKYLLARALLKEMDGVSLMARRRLHPLLNLLTRRVEEDDELMAEAADRVVDASTNAA